MCVARSAWFTVCKAATEKAFQIAMSPALNLLSNNLQVYGPSSLPCLGVSGRAVSISPCRQSEGRTLHMSVMSPKCNLRHKSFVCKARFGGERRDSDFSGQNGHGFSQSWPRLYEERGESADLREAVFQSAMIKLIGKIAEPPRNHPGRQIDTMERLIEILRELRELSENVEEIEFFRKLEEGIKALVQRRQQNETDPMNGRTAEFSAAAEDNVDEREAEKQHTELKDLNAMKLDELREVARARGMKGYSELTKSELLGLLSSDAI